MITFKNGKELKKGDLFRFATNTCSFVPVEIYPLYAENYDKKAFISGLSFGERISESYPSVDEDCYSSVRILDMIFEEDECPLIFEYLGNGKCKETISNQVFSILYNSEECLPGYNLNFFELDGISKFGQGIQNALENPVAIKIGRDYDGEEIKEVNSSFMKKNEEFKSKSDSYVEFINLLIEASKKLVKYDIENVVKTSLCELDEMTKAFNSNSRHM